MSRFFGRPAEPGPSAIGSEPSDCRKVWVSGNFSGPRMRHSPTLFLPTSDGG
jgi:hypothetical protein